MSLDFGIEIETVVPGQRALQNRVAEGLARDITEAGAACAYMGYTHDMHRHWKIVTDASIRAPEGYVGLEVVSPPLSDPGLPQIDAVCNTLKRVGAKTNRSCGLHVHIGARHLDIATLRRLTLSYLQNEDVIDSLMPPSRRKNNNDTYLGSLKTHANIQRIKNAWSVEELAIAVRHNISGYPRTEKPSRYVKLNLTSYWRHGTVEFRQHSGTIDPEKIKRWIAFCQKMVDVAGVEESLPSVSDPQQEARLQAKLAKIHVAAAIYRLASRPEGVTPSEARLALGWKATPNPAIDLARLGVRWYTDGTRNRQKVYKIDTSVAAPATLESLLEKLKLDEQDAEFWKARAALLVTAVAQENDTAHFIEGEQFHAAGAVTGRLPPVEGGHTLADILRGTGDTLTNRVTRNIREDNQ